MKAIKRRIKSVGSTRQITKAMELVASSKLRKAKSRAEQARPYFNELYKALCEIASANTDFSTIFTEKREVKNKLFIVVAGDRGMAGGYNSNVLKMAAAAHAEDAELPKISPSEESRESISRSAAMMLWLPTPTSRRISSPTQLRI